MRPAPSNRAVVAALFGREVWAARRSLAAWLAPTAALLSLTASIQPQMVEKGNLFEQKLALAPKALLAAMNISTALNMADPVQYLAMNTTTWMLLGALFAGLLGATLLSKEEAWHTAELLLTMPVRRDSVALGKVLAGLALIAGFDAALGGCTFATYAAKHVVLRQPGTLAMLFIAAAFVHSTLFSLALFSTVRLRRPRTATAVGLSVVFGTWACGGVANLSPRLALLRWLSPFRYADPASIVTTGSPLEMAALPILALALLSAAVALWSKKDIHA